MQMRYYGVKLKFSMGETLDTFTSEAVQDPEASKKTKQSKEERVSKKELLRNVIVFWISIFLSIFIYIFLVVFKTTYSYFDFYCILNVSLYSLIATSFFLIMFANYFHVRVLLAMRNDDLYILRPADNLIIKFFIRKAYRSGHNYVGIKLQAVIENEKPSIRISKLIKFLQNQNCKHNRPVIIRSHIFTARRWREELIKQLDSEGMTYSVETNLTLQNPFKLKCVTAAITALGGKIPSIYAHEVEIVVYPISKNESLAQA
ncbi:hypothetical protein A6A26_21955 [Pantoea sp. OXWO6B1]|nr:hypothetical protein A6A26_21955 [Pantoea sp. OXWO6B1]